MYKDTWLIQNLSSSSWLLILFHFCWSGELGKNCTSLMLTFAFPWPCKRLSISHVCWIFGFPLMQLLICSLCIRLIIFFLTICRICLLRYNPFVCHMGCIDLFRDSHFSFFMVYFAIQNFNCFVFKRLYLPPFKNNFFVAVSLFST